MFAFSSDDERPDGHNPARLELLRLSSGRTLHRFSGVTRKAEEMHAAPLMPLRERDWQALLELFQQRNMEAIETDIHHNLALRWPEPCWEDDLANLLAEYL